MNLLALVNRMRRECGVATSDLTTVVGASGESQRITDWVVQAWTEIQEEHPEWNWLRSTVSFDTIANQFEYTPTDAIPVGIALTDFGSWDEESFRIYLTATGTPDEMFLEYRDYANFRDLYQFSSFRTTYMRPLSLAVRPNDKALLLGPTPDTVYTVVGEYFTSPVELALDADTPAMPSRFHMAIVYRAMQSYALYEAAPEVMTRGQTGYNEMLKRIEFDQLMPVTTGGPLA